MHLWKFILLTCTVHEMIETFSMSGLEVCRTLLFGTFSLAKPYEETVLVAEWIILTTAVRVYAVVMMSRIVFVLLVIFHHLQHS